MSYNDDEALGFKRPPRWAQFKPGQSGNPKGRPKKKAAEEPTSLALSTSEFDEMIRAQLDRTITINEGGKPKKLKMREVISLAQMNSAAKGNVYAQKEVLKTFREIDVRDTERALALAEQARLDREEEIALYKRMVVFKKSREEDWATAQAEGKEPNDPWPHPDDILLFPNEQRWRLRGPFDARDLARFKWYRAERDYVFALGILESAQSKQHASGLWDAYTVMWVSYDVKLPLRWQLSHNMEVAFFNLAILTTKKLEAEVEQRRKHAAFMQALAGVPDGWDKESYKVVNNIMKPLLKRQGYRSLREFEHAFETHGEDMAWPRQKDQKTA